MKSYIDRVRIQRFFSWGMLVWLCFSWVVTARCENGVNREEIQQVRNIFSNKCFSCHGPDEKNRKSKLRLDSRQDAYAKRESGTPLVPGKAEESLVFERIISTEADEVMPPPKSGKNLTDSEKELIRKWITAGAPWADHWAFIPPVRPKVPEMSTSEAIHNPIDAFIQQKLDLAGLKANGPADKTKLVRRLYLDLVGLPPTPGEVDVFLADRSESATNKLVSRLLDSPHFGERWAQMWLDGARYADSDGYEKDKGRMVWAYRDWVVAAMNRDLPYNQFLVEQLAGDLIPNARDDQRVATGFLRNSMINEEGGIDPEQFRMEAMFDRMDAVGKSMMGLTIQCAQCHNHKFDPMTQEDYYRVFASINNSHEASIPVYTVEDERKRADVLRKVRELEDGLREKTPGWQEKLMSWEQSISSRPESKTSWEILRPQLDSSGGQKHYLLGDGSILAAGYAPTKHTTEFTSETKSGQIGSIKLELLNDPNLPLGGPGRSIYGLFGLSEITVLIGPKGKPDEARQVRLVQATSDANPAEKPLDNAFDDKTGKKRVTGPVGYAIDGKPETAWTTDLGLGRSNVPRQAVFQLEKPVEYPDGAIITVKLNQSHGGWNSDDNQNNNLGRFRFAVSDNPKAKADKIPARVREVLAIEPSKRTRPQWETIFSHYRTTVDSWKESNDQIESAWREHPQGSSQMVLAERLEPRMTHRLERGDFLKPRETVKPGIPAFLNSSEFQSSLPARLQFAQWVASEKSPTTARSIVNRLWQSYFGTGLVATSEDLGSQAETPSHPELLDWLAVELMENGWSLKHMHRLITSSAAYQRDSRVIEAHLQKDPFNRLLARGPRVRVDAEMVRDIALSASGLLNPAIGGPSVFPPAPDFLFLPPVSYGPKVWREEKGENRYRRSLYTFRYRSVPYPALQIFDAPNGDFSCVRRSRSNTPMQALVTLNETTFTQAARALGSKTLKEGGLSDLDKATFAFRRCVSRMPSEEELKVLLQLKTDTVRQFKTTPEKAMLLAGAEKANGVENPGMENTAELAGWIAVSRVLLNLDETITRE
ncbi:MAG: PSD1 and planctomycete cytochrome C domain-containing protein [bacterium]